MRNPIGWNGSLYPLGPPGSGAAEKTTVAGAQAAVGYPVPVPSTAAASRANLTQVWVSNTRYIPRKDRQVALVFDKGKVDILMHRATRQSALHYFHAFMRSSISGATASLSAYIATPKLTERIPCWPLPRACTKTRDLLLRRSFRLPVLPAWLQVGGHLGLLLSDRESPGFTAPSGTQRARPEPAD